MKDSALSVANYFVQKSLDGDNSLKPLKLMKLVYIAHGYMLALLGYSVLNPRFDKVEAWKFGPVVPAVYHSFKQYGNQPIKKKTGGFTDVRVENDEFVFDYIKPDLQDNKAKMVCEVVWNKYKNYSDSSLVSMLHGGGTPWRDVYVEGENRIIPDELTKVYYKRVTSALIKAGKKWQEDNPTS